MVVEQTVNRMFTIAFGLLILVGVIVAVSALKDNQYSYACSAGASTPNSSKANCYTYTNTDWEIWAEFSNYTTDTAELSKTSLKDAACVITACMNASNSLAVPDSNYSLILPCIVFRDAKIGDRYVHTNWTVNYTVAFSNLTGTSTYTSKYNSAYNLTRNTEVMTNQFGSQLETVGTMFGVGLIIAAIAVLGVGLYNKSKGGE